MSPRVDTNGASVPSEHDEQCSLMQWAEVATWGAAPEHRAALDLLHAIPNGGQRHVAVAAKLKAEGVRPGVPDLCLPARSADGQWPCLWIELKRTKGGRTSKAQAEWHEALHAQGHRVEVARGWVEAARLIVEYLGMPSDRAPRAQGGD